MLGAVDTGGTFTDVMLYNKENGDLWSAKIPSSPKNPADAFISGLKEVLSSAAAEFHEIDSLSHGTTVVTNSLLEGKTARVGLLVSEGFRDLLEIGRQVRPDLYDLTKDRCVPIVSRDRVKEVEERVDAQGRIVIPLNKREAQSRISELKKGGIESLAVSFLFSFFNPDHEIQIRKMAKEIFPKEFVFLSSEISPEFREYERTSTTAVAAAVAPKVVLYLDDLKRKLAARNEREISLFIMHSGGGILTADEAKKRPHTIVESGPAAGIVASAQLAQNLGLEQVIAFDMGGTTAKAGLVLNGKPQYTTDYEVGGDIHHGSRTRGSGYPVRFPMIDVAECGSGAGSIAWIDPGRYLKVGPLSAGADPGPACYGRGGRQPTVTDAYLALGYLAAESFLGGKMILQPELARKAITRFIAKPLDMKFERAAQGILTIANADILRILRLVSVARGHDPRDFSLVAYGGAGPLHATALAEEMSIGRVVIPRFPGLFSSLGLLFNDMTTDFVQTLMVDLDEKFLKQINNSFSFLRRQAEDWFQRLGTPDSDHILKASADLRYMRQNYELNVKFPGLNISAGDVVKIRNLFNEVHDATYGHSSPSETIQVVNIRLQAISLVSKPELKPIEKASASAESVSFGKRDIWLARKNAGRSEAELLHSALYRRDDLRYGHTIKGPAVIQEKESTTLVRPGWELRVDRYGNLVIENNVF